MMLSFGFKMLLFLIMVLFTIFAVQSHKAANPNNEP